MNKEVYVNTLAFGFNAAIVVSNLGDPKALAALLFMVLSMGIIYFRWSK